MIKKITQYLLQRRYALSLLLMLMLLQPVMAQTQTRQMYARLDRLSGNLVGISINLCKSIQKELFINDTS